jgi:hypothetical protein
MFDEIRLQVRMQVLCTQSNGAPRMADRPDDCGTLVAKSRMLPAKSVP